MAIQYRTGTAYRNTYHYSGESGGNPTYLLSAKARIQAVIIYDQLDSYTYDDIRSPYDAGIFSSRTLSMRAAISGIIKTISARANIRGLKLLSAKAYIHAPQIISAGAWVSRQQGWPVPDTADPGYALWQDTRLDSRACLYQYIAFPVQNLRAKSRITYAKTLEMQAQARIVAAQRLQMKASIMPRFFTVHVPAYFNVQQTAEKHLRVVFYTGGKVRNWQVTARARILQTYGYRVTGHFTIPMSNAFTSVLAISNPITDTRTQQTLNIRARVIK